MLNKLLSASAIAAFALTACSSDDTPVAAGPDYSANSSSSIQSIPSSESDLNSSSSSVTNVQGSESSSSAFSSSSAVNNSRVTCTVDVDEDTRFQMTILKPDSIKIIYKVTYENEELNVTGITEFGELVPDSVFLESCDVAKKLANYATTEVAVKGEVDGRVTCENKTITESGTIVRGTNAVAKFAPKFVDDCDKIQETGVILEDYGFNL
jgi:hypothetical protein